MENTNNQGFTFDLPKGNSSIIKVIGVGGGGNNALKHMYEKGIHGVDFIICNTDSQTLESNPVANKVQLGVSITEGLGAGADPDVGEKAAIESMEEIKLALGSNTKMVFITAGMGGGTGTGAAPVIAKIAKEMGILTIAIVTVPFSFEGNRRLEQANLGLEKLRNNVDSLIVINNDKLRQQFGDLGFRKGFAKADEILSNAAKGMAEVITAPFTINIDFRDAKTVLQNSGTALMSTGVASGEKRAEEAVKKALDSPLLNDNKITGAKDVLLLILSGSDESTEATMAEIGTVNDYIQTQAGKTANMIFGVGTDAELGDAIKVLVIATGFSKENEKQTGPTEKIKYHLNEVAGKSRVSPFRIKNDEGEPKSFSNLKDNGFTNQQEKKSDSFSFQFDNKMEPTKLTNLQNETRSIEFEVIETEPSIEKQNAVPNLFSYDQFTNTPDSQAFYFETDEPKESSNFSSSEKEKTIDFSFVLNEKEIKESVNEDFNKDIEEKKENILDETSILSEESKEEFIIIDKSTPNQAHDKKRNKLKDFNYRFHVKDEHEEFENIPAFKRRNIVIGQQKPSEQNISHYIVENEDGTTQINQNKYLNKDVD